MIKITNDLSIHDDELEFTASRSSGPGGQHVNKVNTRVTLLFNITNSQSLSVQQQQRIMKQLQSRINKNKILQIVSQGHRSQIANKEAAIERFAQLIKQALTVQPPRKKTTISQKAHQRRIEKKKQQGMKKRRRGRVSFNDIEG